MPLAPEKSGPSPWLMFAVSVAVTVGGLVWGASQRDADLRHEQEARAALEKRVESLESYRGDMREVLADIKAELRNMRSDMAEMKRLLRGSPGTKYAADN